MDFGAGTAYNSMINVDRMFCLFISVSELFLNNIPWPHALSSQPLTRLHATEIACFAVRTLKLYTRI